MSMNIDNVSMQTVAEYTNLHKDPDLAQVETDDSLNGTSDAEEGIHATDVRSSSQQVTLNAQSQYIEWDSEKTTGNTLAKNLEQNGRFTRI